MFFVTVINGLINTILYLRILDSSIKKYSPITPSAPVAFLAVLLFQLPNLRGHQILDA